MLKAKLHETRQCPSCGWLMRLQVDPESVWQMGNASNRASARTAAFMTRREDFDQF
jgi:hypothetical protein